MIKLRIQGTEEEIKRYKELMKQDERIEILQISDLYKNRGETKYCRIYADVEIKQ